MLFYCIADHWNTYVDAQEGPQSLNTTFPWHQTRFEGANINHSVAG